jgi:hypothetical protein
MQPEIVLSCRRSPDSTAEQEVRMRANIWGMTCFALAAGWTMTLLAQGGPTTEKSSGQTVAVIGCVTKAPASAGGRGGTTGPTGSSSASYMLTKVSPAPADIIATKESASQSKPAPASQYRLTGSDSMIGLYDGHQVQITGTLDSSAPASGNVPTLKVDTVYVKSNTCS